MLSTQNDFGVVLVTSFYIGSNNERNREIETCLIKNSQNRCIKKIHLLNDQVYDLSFLDSQDKIVQVVVNDENKSRLGFDYAISYTNNVLSGEICMIANSDLYYNDTLIFLNKYDFTNKVLAISRHEHSTQKLMDTPFRSQDTWVYISPVSVDISACNFKFGTPSCDHIISDIFSRKNNIINPCITIQGYHCHASNYRTYTDRDIVHGLCRFVQPVFLDLTHCFLDSINQYIDSDGFLAITYLNKGYFSFVHNYYLTLKKLDVSWNLLAVCIDEDAYSLCKKNGISCVLFNISDTKEFAQWNTNHFLNVTCKKLDVIYTILKNKNIKKLLYTDTDIAVYKDYVPYLKSLDGDIYFQSDCSFANINMVDSNYCSGFIYMKNTQSIQNLFIGINERIPYNILSEQDILAYRISNSNVIVHQLPRHLFPNGVFFNNNCVPDDAMLLHYNYMIGKEKQINMISRGDWLIKIDEVKTEEPIIKKKKWEGLTNLLKKSRVETNTENVSIVKLNLKIPRQPFDHPRRRL